MHEEAEAIAAQMGRPLAGTSRVAVRCPLGLPLVIEASPVGDEGQPFPTLYYLTCPLARTRISRLEHAGWVRRLTARLGDDPAFAAALAGAHADYARAREEALPPEGLARGHLRGGVGGTDPAGGVKCLHAHYAHGCAGGRNPVADVVRPLIEPLECRVPCVAGGARNQDWREPVRQA